MEDLKKKIELLEFVSRIFKKNKADASIALTAINELQKQRLDDFFQWRNTNEMETSPSDGGFQQLLEEQFPVSLHDGKILLKFVSYGMEKMDRDKKKCLQEHTTYGIRFYLKLAVDGHVDTSLKKRVEDSRHYIQCVAKGMDVVPYLTEKNTLIVRSGAKTDPPLERCLVSHIGLISKLEQDPENRYDLSNMRLYFFF